MTKSSNNWRELFGAVVLFFLTAYRPALAVRYGDDESSPKDHNVGALVETGKRPSVGSAIQLCQNVILTTKHGIAEIQNFYYTNSLKLTKTRLGQWNPVNGPKAKLDRIETLETRTQTNKDGLALLHIRKGDEIKLKEYVKITGMVKERENWFGGYGETSTGVGMGIRRMGKIHLDGYAKWGANHPDYPSAVEKQTLRLLPIAKWNQVGCFGDSGGPVYNENNEVYGLQSSLIAPFGQQRTCNNATENLFVYLGHKDNTLDIPAWIDRVMTAWQRQDQEAVSGEGLNDGDSVQVSTDLTDSDTFRSGPREQWCELGACNDCDAAIAYLKQQFGLGGASAANEMGEEVSGMEEADSSESTQSTMEEPQPTETSDSASVGQEDTVNVSSEVVAACTGPMDSILFTKEEATATATLLNSIYSSAVSTESPVFENSSVSR